MLLTNPVDVPVGGGRRDGGEVGACGIGRPEDGVRRRPSVDDAAQTGAGLADTRRRRPTRHARLICTAHTRRDYYYYNHLTASFPGQPE